ncbi:adenosine deaminase 2-like [Pectinophora gossypiella]|uniref:adenosine deaminase 2-like n=1 Tax=Pectinophora gossypiella TaxID=13191 RepID=UPI00214F0779|nr:adenosine deaminase 2-like [Pectinophora gossypiella]
MMRLIPKGALLHTHDMGVARPDFLLQVTYEPLLYVCSDHPPKFLFSSILPKHACDSDWQLMTEARTKFGDVNKFDAELKKYFSLVTSDLRDVYPDVNAVWRRKYDYRETVKVYKTVLDKFSHRYKDFYGGRLIYSPSKLSWRTMNITNELQKAEELKREFPDLIAGTISTLVQRFGTWSDENLVDAVLLKPKRIGNPHALVKHPLLMNLVKQNDIALEVNVISDQVLNLVDDFRNHPLSVLLAYDMPVVIASDYNFLWEANSLTHDFYVIFTGVSSERSDLRLLKQLALNSMKYNTVKDKRPMEKMFQDNWNQFLDRVLENFS